MTKLNNKIGVINKILKSGSEQSFLNIINKKRLGKYENFLISKLSVNPVPIEEIFKFGIENLPTDELRPNLSLSSYFFVITEIKELPEELYNLAMEAMIYCKNDSDVPTKSLFDLNKIYKKALC
ncbi:MAG: hypothetical protein AAB334_00260 [Patescibacteria group bacterium]